MSAQKNSIVSRLGLAVLMCGMSLSGAWAQKAQDPELYFYPAKSWAVEKVQGRCAMSAPFNNGFVLGLSGAQGALEGLTIDFRQNVFKPSEPYGVSLGVSGQEKAFQGRAQTPGVLSVGLKGQDSFYKALKGASMLDIAVEKNHFRFDLAGFSAGAGAFDHCMTGEVAVVSPSVIPAPVLARAPAPLKNPAPVQVGAQGTAGHEARTAEQKEKHALSESQPVPLQVRVPADPLPVLREVSPDALPDQAGLKEPAPVKHAGIVGVSEDKTPQDGMVSSAEPVSAPAPVVKKEPVMVAPAPGLVNKNALSPERLSRMVAEQIGGKPVSGASPSGAPAQKPVALQEASGAVPVAKDVLPVKAETASSALQSVAQHNPVALEQAPQDRPRPVMEAKVQERPAMPDAAPALTPSTPSTSRKTVHKAQADFRDLPLPSDSFDEAVTQTLALEAIEPSAKDARRTEISKERPERGAGQDVAALKKTLEALKAENLALNNELNKSLDESRTERVSISGDNWDLEQATMKFDEAERQTKRLGLELQKERARCVAEKKDLEAMLFDPALTNQEQLAQLTKLEQQLNDAKEELKLQQMRYEARLRVLEKTNAP